MITFLALTSNLAGCRLCSPPRLCEIPRSTCAAVMGCEIAALAREPADMVIIANTFHGVPDETRVCQAVASALKPGGRFVVVNWHRRPREETTVFGQPRGPKTEMRMEPSMIETDQSQEPAESTTGAQSPMAMAMAARPKI